MDDDLVVELRLHPTSMGVGPEDDDACPYFGADILLADTEGDGEKKIGLIYAYLFLGSRSGMEEVVDAADSVTSDTCHAAKLAYQEDGWVEDQLELGFSYDLVFVRMLYLEPEYRGKGIASDVLDKFIARVGYGCHGVILQAVPQKEDAEGHYCKDESGDQAKLVEYYERREFVRIPDTDYMFKVL